MLKAEKLHIKTKSSIRLTLFIRPKICIKYILRYFISYM